MILILTYRRYNWTLKGWCDECLFCYVYSSLWSLPRCSVSIQTQRVETSIVPPRIQLREKRRRIRMRKSRTRAKLKAASLIPDFSGKMERVYEQQVKIQQLECEMPRVPATERWNMYPEICRTLISAFAPQRQ